MTKRSRIVRGRKGVSNEERKGRREEQNNEKKG